MNRYLIGAIGGLMPLVLSVAVLDGNTITDYVLTGNYVRAVGYVIRGVILAGLGILWVYLNRSETEPIKIFQLGIMAPAILNGLIQSSELTALSQEPHQASTIHMKENRNHSLLQLIPMAYAGTDPGGQAEGGFWNQVWAGFLGRPVGDYEDAPLSERPSGEAAVQEQIAQLERQREELVAAFEGSIARPAKSEPEIATMQRKLEEKVAALALSQYQIGTLRAELGANRDRLAALEKAGGVQTPAQLLKEQERAIAALQESEARLAASQEQLEELGGKLIDATVMHHEDAVAERATELKALIELNTAVLQLELLQEHFATELRRCASPSYLATFNKLIDRSHEALRSMRQP